jgi:hypothetical protein
MKTHKYSVNGRTHCRKWTITQSQNLFFITNQKDIRGKVHSKEDAMKFEWA